MTIGFILLFAGIIAAIIGTKLRKQGQYLLVNGKRATAVVIDNKYRPSAGSSGGVYHPVIRFLTEKKEWITKEMNTGYKPARRVGREIAVIYDPAAPNNVRTNSIFWLEMFPAFLISAGIVLLVLGVLLIFGLPDFLTQV